MTAIVGLGCACGLAFGRAPFAYVQVVMVICLALAAFYFWQLLVLRDHLARHGDLAIFAEGEDLVVFAPYRARLKLREIEQASIEHVAHRQAFVEVITFKAPGKVIRAESALYDVPASRVIELVRSLPLGPTSRA